MNPISRTVLFAACVSALFVTASGGNPAPSLPSDPYGVYAVIDQARLLPDDEHPVSIDLRGAFALAESGLRDYVRAPVYGRLVMTAPEGKRDECVTVWRDLVRLAGTGTVVGFSSRYEQQGMEVCTERDEHPRIGVMAAGWSVRKVENIDWGPARDLRRVCRLIAPLDGGTASVSVTRRSDSEVGFSWHNCADTTPGLRFLVQVERAVESFASPLIEPGDGTTTWKTVVALAPSEVVRWSVQAVHPDGGRCPVSRGSFTVGTTSAKDR